MKVSIILPVYNGEKYLAKSIESCLNQTYKNIELLIVNDCSTDNTLQIINQYAEIDNRVRIINNEENKKLPASLNIGHKEAEGDLITWTSDDNFYELNALEVMLVEMLEKKADIVYSDFFLIDAGGCRLRRVSLHGIENIIFGNFISCCFLYKKEVYIRNKGYDENLFLVEDYDFWLRAILHSSYSQIKKALYNYRKHPQSLTSQIGIDDDKNELWKKNVNKMYANFCQTILVCDTEEISELLFKNLTNQRIDFDWIININTKIIRFKEILHRNQNFLNKKILERVFLNKSIELMILDQNLRSNFFKSIFIIKQNFFILNKNDVKTLLKYSFFK